MTNDTEAATFISGDLLARLAEKHLTPDNQTGRISGAMVADLIVIPEGLRAGRTWPCWLGCVETDHIDSDVGRVWTEGGTIMLPPEDIADDAALPSSAILTAQYFFCSRRTPRPTISEITIVAFRGVPARHKRTRGPRQAVAMVMAASRSRLILRKGIAS